MYIFNNLRRKRIISCLGATVLLLCFMFQTDQISAAEQKVSTPSQNIIETDQQKDSGIETQAASEADESIEVIEDTKTAQPDIKEQENTIEKYPQIVTKGEGIVTLGDGEQYYYKDGVVAHNITGFITYAGKWYKIIQGKVDNKYTGMGTADTDNWCYFTKGIQDTSYSGMANNEYGWWYYVDGKIDWGHTGLEKNIYGTWYYENGTIDFNRTEYVRIDGALNIIVGGRLITEYTGIGQADTDNWCYFRDGVEDFSYTGLANNEYGWWYYINGQIDWGHTGLETNEFGTWYYENGTIDFNRTEYVRIAGALNIIEGGRLKTEYTGIGTADTDNWCYFKDGIEDLTYTGLAQNEFGWWYYNNGQIIWDYTGFATNEYGTWYLNQGYLDFGVSGFIQFNNAWYKIIGGRLDTAYTGMGTAFTDNWCYFEAGVESFTYTGMANNTFGWWYYKDGKIDFAYNGFGVNGAGTWLYKNGTIDMKYQGFSRIGNTWWYVNRGRVDFKKCIAYDGKTRNITCWGDSMTYGYGSGSAYIDVDGGKDISGTTYPSELKNLTNVNVNNFGINGQTTVQIADRAENYYKTHTEDNILIIEMGSNGGWNNNYNTLIEQYKEIIRNANTSYYIIIGNTDDPGYSYGDTKQTPFNADGTYLGSNQTNWEKALSEAFGDHFFNTRQYLLKNGLSDCGLTPTKQDLDMIKKGKMPIQLRFDDIHFNSYGYYAKAQGIYQKGQQLGYWE